MSVVTWAQAIVGVLKTRPSHRWILSEIYSEIAKLPIVTRHHRDTWGGQPNYHHFVRSELAKLARRGIVEHVARSTYRLG